MERIDDLQINNLKLIQDSDLFCFGCDAVELANFAGEKMRGTVCDLGAGNGIISVLLAGKFNKNVTAVEIQESCARLAERNSILNGLTNKMSVVNMSMQQFADCNSGKSFGAVVCNPPYRKIGSGVRQAEISKEIARHEILVSLKEVVLCASKLLSSGGKFFMIHQCERLAETMFLCKSHSLEPKSLQVLVPNLKKAPHIFMIECVKNGKGGLNVLREREVKAYGIE